MKIFTVFYFGLLLTCSGIITHPVSLTKQPEKGKVVFAVIDDGKIIEPVAILSNGSLASAIGGEPGSMELPEFAAMYYSPKTAYTLIIGGKANGKVTVVSNDPGADCAAAMAGVTTTSAKIKLKGHEYALATNISSNRPASGIRRTATPAEKAAIDKLVAAEFRKNKSVGKLLKTVRLTVLDTDNDKVNEIVGTYTVAPATSERGLLFFIATKTKTGGYSISFSEYNAIKQDEVMSGDIKDVDEGIYQEMLLDVLDTDNSGASKIFTMKLSFEGVGFHIYKRNGGKWERETEVSNYHCGY